MKLDRERNDIAFNTILCLFLVAIGNFVYAQNPYFNKQVKKLTSDTYNGRGYTYDGMNKASHYIAKEFKKIGVKPVGESYLNEQQFPINIIHDAKIKINGNELVYGKDFIVKPSSKSIAINDADSFYTFPINNFETSFESKAASIAFIKNDEERQKNKNIILPPFRSKIDSINTFYKQWANSYEKSNNQNRAIFRFVSDSLTASLSQRQANVTEFIIKEKFYSDNLKIEDVEVKAEFVKDFKFNNVIGVVEGKNSDSVIVISGHYDHLGRVGGAIFPGASDNASGTAMVMDLAKYYVKNKPKYKMVFMLFGAEEAGIVGALKYVENPLFPLKEIKFLVNLDIMGAGEDGIQVVNGTKYKNEFNTLVRLNENLNLLRQVKVRGESCNSDHCPFDRKGVPSFFIYTLGGKGNYHNIYDTYQNLDLSYAPKVKELLIAFIKGL